MILRRCVQCSLVMLVIVCCLVTSGFAQEQRENTRAVSHDPKGQRQEKSPSNNLAQLLEAESSWSILSYAPMAAILSEFAAKTKPNLAYEVLKLVAKSANAATTTVTEQSNMLVAGMTAFSNRTNGYAFYRPRDWRESTAGVDALREEDLLSGEVFVSPESGAFISSAYRRFKSGLDGAIPLDAITPEVLIETLLRKLRKLPGVNEIRETARSVSIKKGFERAEVGLEISFRPTINNSSVTLVGRAVILRNTLGVFELIGLRQNLSPSNTIKMIELSINSAKLAGQ